MLTDPSFHISQPVCLAITNKNVVPPIRFALAEEFCLLERDTISCHASEIREPCLLPWHVFVVRGGSEVTQSDW